MRTWIMALALAAALPGQNARPTRQEIAALEKSFNQRLARLDLERPVEVLGMTRGVYLDGYGVVFTAEINLAPAPGLSPFRPALSKEEVARIRELKLKRLPQIKALMQQLLLAAAQSLDRLPADEHVALALLLWSNPWEDAAGLPRAIQMQGRKGALLEVALERQPPQALAQILRVREE
ncbi:MAG: hypothetical protein WHT08_06470 [Bryobacteraceae bacterium]